jgi:P pilus assembly chaperone PapD
MSFLSRRRFFLPFAVFLSLWLFAQPCFASLVVTPIRVIFDGRTRSAVMLLVNTDRKAHTYRLGWELMKASETGQYHEVPIDPKDPHSVTNMVIFSPRQVRIDSGGQQSIRLSLRKPADLPPGEYRAHLTFVSMPGDEEEVHLGDGGKKGSSFNLKVSLSVAVPIIVRNSGGSNLSQDISISEPSLVAPLATNKNGMPSMRFSLVHAVGANSTYGRIRVYMEGDKERQIGVLNNLSVYPEQAKRIVNVTLSEPVPQGSRLKIVYEGAQEYKGKTLAEKEIAVGQ